MRVLFTTPILEHPPAGGPQLRIENSIKALSKVCDLYILHRAHSPTKPVDEADKFYQRYAKTCTTIYMRPLAASSSWWIRQYSRVVNRLADFASKRHGEYILEYTANYDIDVVWFGYGNISYSLIRYIKRKRPDLKVVCDTDSVWSRFILRELPYTTKLRRLRILYNGYRKRREERAWVDVCDVTTAVSEIDASYYRDIAADPNRVWVFPNAIDIDSYRSMIGPPDGFKRPSVYLAGTFGHYHSPMDAAARWVLEEVLPIVWRVYPELHFYIVGRGSEKGFGNVVNPNVTVTGRLDSVLPYLKNATIALVPLKFESGTRFKILEAGSCGIPIVSTTLGAEGIPVVDGKHILLADTPQEFATAILRLLADGDLAAKISQNCHDLVNVRFSVAALQTEASKILEFLSHD